jgi:hypothetical protein
MVKELDDNNQFDTANDQGGCWAHEEHWSSASKGAGIRFGDDAPQTCESYTTTSMTDFAATLIKAHEDLFYKATGRAVKDLVHNRWVLGDRVFPRGPAPGALDHCRGPVRSAGVPLGALGTYRDV